MVAVERSSVPPLAADRVWSRAVSEPGINDELRPVLRMTMPAGLRGRTLDDVPVGTRLGRSWLLLGGLLAVDFDDLCLAEVEPGRRFLERSQTLAFAVWQHERVVEPEGGGCRLTDRLGFELRAGLRWIPGASTPAAAIVGALFDHRHRRLRAWAESATWTDSGCRRRRAHLQSPRGVRNLGDATPRGRWTRRRRQRGIRVRP